MVIEKITSKKKFGIDVRPLHMRLEEAMELLLREYNPGDRLPSEEELTEIMGVSRSTIREVLRALEERGRIIRRHGVGTFIASNKPLIESGLEILESLDAFANRIGIICEVKDLRIYEEPADEEVAFKLQVGVNTPLTVVTRIRVVENTNIAYMYDATPASIVTAEQLRPGFTGSILDYFKKNIDPGHWYAITNVLSIEANKDIALKMQVARGSALLLLEESLYRSNNQLVNYSRRYYNTKFFRYHIVRRSIK
jgi:GntR family transcriptional regulator